MPTVVVQQLRVPFYVIRPSVKKVASTGREASAITLAIWHRGNCGMDEFHKQKRQPVPLGLHP